MTVLMRNANVGTMEALRNREFMTSYPAADVSPHLSARTVGSSLLSTSSTDSSAASPDMRGRARNP
jgi:hypothetical protein